MTIKQTSGNRVRRKRISSGLTQAALAQRAGISRTAVTAIEADRLIPSVAAALAIAESLGATVEELFGTPARKSTSERWAWDSAASPNFWHAEVAGAIVRYPTTSMPMLTPLPDAAWTNTRCVPEETLVLACCDPAAGLLASQFQAVTGMRLIVIPRSSSQAIEMLRDGLVHLAGLHFSTADHPDRNSDIVGTRLGNEHQLIRLSRWQEGIVLAPGSTHRTVRSALSAKLTWIGREDGSGARQCLDQVLQGRRTPRYIARNHQGVATAVQSGWADAGVCVRLVSEEAALRFLPVQEEAYDVCYAKAFAGDRRLKAFINVVRSTAYRKLLSDLPGYDTAETGSVGGPW